MNEARYRAMILREPVVDVRICGDTIYLKHPVPLQVRDTDLVAMLERCCDLYAHQLLFAERDNAQWRTVTSPISSIGCSAWRQRCRRRVLDAVSMSACSRATASTARSFISQCWRWEPSLYRCRLRT